MCRESDKTKEYLAQIKSNKILAIAILVVISITSLGTFTEAIDKLIMFKDKIIASVFSEEKLYFKRDGSQVNYAGGDGSSTKEAVMVLDAKSADIGIDAMYFWISQKYPSYRPVAFSRYTEEPRQAIVKIISSDGTEQAEFETEMPEKALRQYQVVSIKKYNTLKEIHFDVTGFHGKPIRDPLIQKIMQKYLENKSNLSLQNTK